jgi:hypothetical protein
MPTYAGGTMSFLEIFQPGLKYLREERDRRKIMVANPTHGGAPPLGIDLDAGTARITISRPVSDSEQASPAETEPRADG